MKLINWLNGKKRNIALLLLLAVTVLGQFGVDVPKITEADVVDHIDKLLGAVGVLASSALGVVGLWHKYVKVRKAKKNPV